MYARLGKRLLDIAASLTGLALLCLPMAVIAAMIALTSGRPVIYAQDRVGRGGQRYRIFKFRTMRERAGFDSTVTVAGDNRVTQLGKWLRRFKLDELPQLWNVLRGDMSLVGPRPDVPGYADRLSGESARLLELRPGVTGLATLVFRDEEELLARTSNPVKFNDLVLYPAKVRINLDYLNRISFVEDLRLILLTIWPARLCHPERERVERALQNPV